VSSTATPTVSESGPAAPRFTRRQCFALVFFCTILGAAAQIFMKIGATQLLHPTLLGIVTNIPLMTGYSLYGLSTLSLIFALRDGELSLLYPVIALTYVWVTILSLLLFSEVINPFKAVGITAIVTGVMILGRGGHR
jgi:multidrug transporter EmrE-like cation transporter